MNSSGFPAAPFDGNYRSILHWRGLSALLLFLFHTTGDGGGHFPGTLIETLHQLTRYGYYGVHFLFVISGYCIAANLHRLHTAHRGTRVFLRQRLLRVYPVYWMACLAVIMMSVGSDLLARRDWHHSLPMDPVPALANFLLIEPYLGNPPPFILITWTLVYEVGFYLLCALGFWLHRRGCRVNLLIDMGIALAVLGMIHTDFKPLYILGLWVEFVFGALVYLALYYRSFSPFHERLTLGTLCGLVLAGWCLLDPYTAMLFSVAAGFALVLYLLHPLDALLSNSALLRPFAWAGVISYSLYLLHCPILSRLKNLSHRFVDLSEPAGALLFQLFIWVATLLGCWIFYILIEAPLERWRHSLNTAPTLRDDLILR